MVKYPVVIHKDDASDYGVTAPDLPGCFSAGETIDEAMQNATEAIECHLEGMLIDQEPIPNPSCVENLQKNMDYADGIWALVSVDISKLSGKHKRVNITLPERLLKLIDQYAKEHGETRSGLISEAAVAYIADRQEGEGE
jgi:predicted RNase H-like HicB family nuclease